MTSRSQSVFLSVAIDPIHIYWSFGRFHIGHLTTSALSSPLPCLTWINFVITILKNIGNKIVHVHATKFWFGKGLIRAWNITEFLLEPQYILDIFCPYKKYRFREFNLSPFWSFSSPYALYSMILGPKQLFSVFDKEDRMEVGWCAGEGV